MQVITFGPFTFHLYGLILGLAIVVGWWLASRLVNEAGVQANEFERWAWWAVVGGVLGARLYHVADYWWYYRDHIHLIVAFWNGGLGIWGAIGGGILGFIFTQLLVSHSQKHSFIRKTFIGLDAAGIVLPLSQSIGRWGNFVNNELFGPPTHLPWKLFIPPNKRPADLASFDYFHPLFLYESSLNLMLFLLLFWWHKKGTKIGSGRLIGAYLIGYGVIRCLLEPFKLDAWKVGGIYTAWWMGGVAVLVGVFLVNRRIANKS